MVMCILYNKQLLNFSVEEKQLQIGFSDNAVDKGTVNHLASQIAGSEKESAESINVRSSGQPTTAVTEALLQCAGELI